MPRANRNFLPGYCYHITHRCHDRTFLLKFDWTKRRWLEWLSEAKSRFHLIVLNYTVTMNHIHLILSSSRSAVNIAKSMQLIAGRTGQEYNEYKGRTGAFWQDRYHATAIDTEGYLLNCMAYIDLNMVRAGVVRHPAEWHFCGYQELMAGTSQYKIIDMDAVLQNLRIAQLDEFRRIYARAIEEKLLGLPREAYWSEGLAVGCETFIQRYQEKMGSRGRRHDIENEKDIYILREPAGFYRTRTLAPAIIHVLPGNNEVKIS